MDKLVPLMYKNYGLYVNHFRMFPLDLDGLRPVERRILLSSYQVARDKFQKAAKIDGTTTGNYHPHGSVYGTIVQLVQNGFLMGQGNWGSNIGIESTKPAASRYTECKLEKRTEDLAFKLIEHVPWVEAEGDKSLKEPMYLPAILPLCLLGHESLQGIGFGYRANIPCYELPDLFKRLLWLLKKTKTKPTIKPITDCNVMSENKVLEQLLTTGKATISVEGIYEEVPDDFKVILRSWPPGRRFESLLSKFRAELENQDIAWIDQSSKKNQTCIEFEVIKQRNKQEIYEKFLKKLKVALQGNVSYETFVVDHKTINVKPCSIDEMLVSCFEMYKKTNDVMLKSEIGKLKTVKEEYKTLEKIRPHLGKHLRGKIEDMETTIKEISIESKVEENIVKDLFSKYRISRLLSLDLDVTGIDDSIKEYTGFLSNIEDFALSSFKGLLKNV